MTDSPAAPQPFRRLAERIVVWGILIAITLGPLLCAGADAVSCAAFIAWGTTVAAVRAYRGRKVGAVVSGAIAALMMGWATYQHYVNCYPHRLTGAVVILIPAAFAFGYWVSIGLGALYTQAAKGLRVILARGPKS